jgi:hypothetical protein
MIHYDPDLDRSEEAGWKKYSHETVPTEQEQQFWAGVTLGCPLVILVLLLLV